MTEKRSLPRVEFDRAIMVFDVAKGELLGHLVNLHIEGMMLTRDTPIEKGTIYRISIALPTLVGSKSTIRCQIECRWSDKSLWSSSEYCAGFQIVNIAKADAEAIELLVDGYGCAQSGGAPSQSSKDRAGK